MQSNVYRPQIHILQQNGGEALNLGAHFKVTQFRTPININQSFGSSGILPTNLSPLKTLNTCTHFALIAEVLN